MNVFTHDFCQSQVSRYIHRWHLCGAGNPRFSTSLDFKGSVL